MGGVIISESGGGIIPLRGAALSRNWGAASSEISTAMLAAIHGAFGVAKPPYKMVAEIWTALCGVPINETNVKDAKRRGAGPDKIQGSIADFTFEDEAFVVRSSQMAHRRVGSRETTVQIRLASRDAVEGSRRHSPAGRRPG